MKRLNFIGGPASAVRCGIGELLHRAADKAGFKEMVADVSP